MRRAVLSIILLLVMAITARAGFDEGLTAIERGDYATALREIRPMAEAGHANSQSVLDAMYYHGEGVAQDYAEAAKWFLKAADQQIVPAQIYLGKMHENGQGLPQNHREAVKLYEEAAHSVTKKAQASLILIHLEGTSSQTNLVQSYLEQVRDNIGIRSLRADLVEAYKWLEVLVPLVEFPEVRNTIYEARNDVARELTPPEIAEAERLASE